MCVKIIRTHSEVEFDPSELLEYQVRGAKKVIIDYNPNDSKIDSFIEQMNRIVKNGIHCSMNVEVNPHNMLDGLRIERKIESLNKELEINEVISSLVQMHNNVDKSLSEIQDICVGER